jgi:competence protein ComEC
MQRLREHATFILLAILVFATAFIWHDALADHRGVLTVAFLDIGQGDSIYIEGPTGIQLLVDGGPDRTVLSRLGEVMPFGDRSLDAVLATHPDQDHIAGLVDVLSSYQVGHFFEPGISNDTNAYTALESAVARDGVPKTLARRGMKVELGGGAEFDVLFPDRDITSGETNDDSVVGEVRYGKTCFLLTGDAPTKSIETYLLYTLRDAHLQCDVLKLGHHGSKYSSGTAWLQAVSPSVAVVSAGKGNRYGHPNSETLARVEALYIPVVSTIESGTVRFESDGETITQK